MRSFSLYVTPDPLDIGVGTEVLFEQGHYRLQLEDGSHSHGYRWHLGVVTNVEQNEDGEFIYSGVHLRGEEDGKWVTFRGYEDDFEGYKIERLRVFPNAMDTYQAFKNL